MCFEGSGKLYLACFLISSTLIIACKSDDQDNEIDEDDPPRSCEKYIYDFVSSIVKAAIICLSGQSTFRMNSIFEYPTRASCLFKCIFQHQQLLGSDGRLDVIQAAGYFERTFDDPVKEITLPIVQGCFAYADEFNPNEYWCKSYVNFTDCAFRAILAGLIPYGGNCITNPLLGTLFAAIKYIAPDTPMADGMDKLRRSMSKNIEPQIKCLDKTCIKKYQYKNVNGTKSIVVYNEDMKVVSVLAASKKSSWKPNKTLLYNKKNNFNFRKYNNYNFKPRNNYYSKRNYKPFWRRQ